MKQTAIIIGVVLLAVAGVLAIMQGGPLYLAVGLFGGACLGLGLIIGP